MFSKITKAGFTIIELLIVIVVIGILAAITIVAFNGVQQRAKVSTAQSDLRNLSQNINIKIIDSVPLSSGLLTSILQETQLYQPTRDRTKKTFSFCYNQNDNSQFAVIAFDPLVNSGAMSNGDKLQAWSTSGGLREITYDTSVVASAVGTRACIIAMPAHTNQFWSFNL